MMPLRRLTLIAPLLLSALLPGPPLEADDEEYIPITMAQVRARSFRSGEKRCITGKYHELINRELKLYDVQARFILGPAHLARQLFDFTAQKDNLTLFGSFREPRKDEGEAADGLPIFEVEKIKQAPPDLELFGDRLREIAASPARTPERFLELILEISLTLNRGADPTLRPLARQAFNEAYAVAEASLGPEDADGRIAFLRKLHGALGDTGATLELLRVMAKRFPGHTPTLGFLRDLKCTQLGGEWVAYPEFKRKLGFVQRGERWVKPARKEFLDIAQTLLALNQTNLILRHRTDREYKLLARSGKVEKGMTREELSEALGLPDRVEREAREGVEVDQWNYGDRRVYLINGQVAALAP